MGLSRIPFTAIYEYAKIYEVDDFEEFRYYIRIMDENVIMHSNSKSKEGNAKTGKKRNNISV